LFATLDVCSPSQIEDVKGSLVFRSCYQQLREKCLLESCTDAADDPRRDCPQQTVKLSERMPT